MGVDNEDYGAPSNSLVGIARRLLVNRATYICVGVMAVIIVVVVLINQGPQKTVTVKEAGPDGSVFFVITGKDDVVSGDEAQVSSDAATLRGVGVSITTSNGDTHLGVQYCQHTDPGTSGGHMTVYSDNAAAGSAVCGLLQGP
jgi:hypothetical protein